MLKFFKTAFYPILFFSFIPSCHATNGLPSQLVCANGKFFNNHEEVYLQHKPKRRLKRSNSFKKLCDAFTSLNSKDEFSPSELYEENSSFFDQKAEQTLFKKNQDFLMMPFGDASLLMKMGKKYIFINPCFALPTPITTRKFVHLLDFILITDNHYLDAQTFKVLAKQSKKAIILTPPGLKVWLVKMGFSPKKIKELWWWEKYSPKPHITHITKERKRLKRTYTFTLLPSHHNSKPLFSKTSCGWGSFLINYKKEKIGLRKRKVFRRKRKIIRKKRKPKNKGISIYFSGQTGPSENFKTIGEKYSIDIAFFPIAAQKDLVINTEYYMYFGSAKRASKELGAQIFVPLFSLYDFDYQSNVRDLPERFYETHDNSITIPFVGESL